MKRLLLPVLVLAAVAVGCKPASMVGTYKDKDQAVELTLKEDSSFQIKVGANPNGDVDGKWKEANGKIVFTTETAGGQPASVVKAQLDKAAAAGEKTPFVDNSRTIVSGFEGTIASDRNSIVITLGGGSMTLSKA